MGGDRPRYTIYRIIPRWRAGIFYVVCSRGGRRSLASRVKTKKKKHTLTHGIYAREIRRDTRDFYRCSINRFPLREHGRQRRFLLIRVAAATALSPTVIKRWRRRRRVRAPVQTGLLSARSPPPRRHPVPRPTPFQDSPYTRIRALIRVFVFLNTNPDPRDIIILYRRTPLK